MPGTDARSGTSSPRATAELEKGAGELAHEEGLATALSAFLSQLHYVPSSGPAMYAPDPGPAAVQAIRANRLPSLVARDTVASTGGAQTGDLAHRLPDVSVVTEATEAEPCQERTSEMLPSRPRLPASGTGGPRPGTIARVPRSDAWARPEPDIQAEAATRPTTAAARLAAIVTSPTPAPQRPTTIDARQSAAAPSTQSEGLAAARAAIAQSSQTSRTFRADRSRRYGWTTCPNPGLGPILTIPT